MLQDGGRAPISSLKTGKTGGEMYNGMRTLDLGVWGNRKGSGKTNRKAPNQLLISERPLPLSRMANKEVPTGCASFVHSAGCGQDKRGVKSDMRVNNNCCLSLGSFGGAPRPLKPRNS